MSRLVVVSCSRLSLSVQRTAFIHSHDLRCAHCRCTHIAFFEFFFCFCFRCGSSACFAPLGFLQGKRTDEQKEQRGAHRPAVVVYRLCVCCSACFGRSWTNECMCVVANSMSSRGSGETEHFWLRFDSPRNTTKQPKFWEHHLPYVLSVGGGICSSLGLLVVCSDELVHFFFVVCGVGVRNRACLLFFRFFHVMWAQSQGTGARSDVIL
ncbi:unnamed protein product [Ectocarpus sp. 8 AP-2014]